MVTTPTTDATIPFLIKITKKIIMHKLLLFFPVWLILGCNPTQKSDKIADKQKDEKSNNDSCKRYTMYHYNGVKRCEGILCNGLREGVWKDWYADGGLCDSGYFIHGRRLYEDSFLNSLMQMTKGTVTFKGNPKRFIKDSSYLFSVRLNQLFRFADVEPYFKRNEKITYEFHGYYPPRDSFSYVFKPLKNGHIMLRLKLNKLSENITDSYVFYEKDINVFEK